VKRKFRLTKSTDFQRVRRLGKTYAHPLVVLVALQNEAGGPPRFGVAAGRSVGKAVVRNRAKRRLRAVLQPYITSVLPGWDVILLARRPILEAPFQQVQAAVSVLMQRAQLLQDVHEQ
jgi:ribonuclease P protein component